MPKQGVMKRFFEGLNAPCRNGKGLVCQFSAIRRHRFRRNGATLTRQFEGSNWGARMRDFGGFGNSELARICVCFEHGRWGSAVIAWLEQ